MKMFPVQSSQIHSCGHEPRTGMLHLKFKSGGTYAYGRVDETKFKAMLDSDSIGSWFHKNLRNNAAHPCSKVEEES